MNFENFLTKYSFANPQQYNLFKEDYIKHRHSFLINSDDLRIFLNIKNKYVFNNILKKNYIINVDYNIDKDSVIKLTPETAKKICLSTNSKRGREIQKYFIDLEFTLHKYKNYIIEEMNQKIKKLTAKKNRQKNNQKKTILCKKQNKTKNS